MTALSFEAHLAARGHGSIRRAGPHTLQLNLGRRCNLACRHCHVGAGPKRTDAMEHRGVERVLEFLCRSPSVETLDMTGGAPELHPDFRFVVSEARRLGRRVIDRCNRTVFFEPGQTDTFNPDTLSGLMCRSLVSVSWDGRLYDCDFNQAVALACGSGRRSIWDVDDLGSLVDSPIATGRHCFGCTAGKGSSCGGALTS